MRYIVLLDSSFNSFLVGSSYLDLVCVLTISIISCLTVSNVSLDISIGLGLRGVFLILFNVWDCFINSKKNCSLIVLPQFDPLNDNSKQIKYLLSKIIVEYDLYIHNSFNQNTKTILKLLSLSKITDNYWNDIKRLLDLYLYSNPNMYMIPLHKVLKKVKQSIVLNSNSIYRLAKLEEDLFYTNNTFQGNNKKYKFIKESQLILKPYKRIIGISFSYHINSVIEYNHSVFDIDTEQINPYYLYLIIHTHTFNKLKENYLKFLNIQIPLPNKVKQNELIKSNNFENLVFPFA